MEEKELIKEIRWSISKGKSRAQITRLLQNKKLKLEYIDSLISKAHRPKRIFVTLLIFLLVFSSLWLSIYLVFFYEKTEKAEFFPRQFENETFLESQNLAYEINPSLISFFISEIGATNLRTSPLSFKKPIINLKISEKQFYTVIDKEIITMEGLDDGADILLSLDEVTLLMIVYSDNVVEEIRTAIYEEKISLTKLSSDKELFLKGYLDIYNQFSPRNL